MSAADPGKPTLLRRMIRLLKRSTLLTGAAWRLYRAFPGLGQRLARRAIRPRSAGRVATPALIVPPSAWDDGVSSAQSWREQLARAVRQGEGGRG
ncbi:MAG: hypothetical protein H7315_13035 [Herminiimonas sp.]|nr:hypothetical protein [Herminiimonas sp.]